MELLFEDKVALATSAASAIGCAAYQPHRHTHAFPVNKDWPALKMKPTQIPARPSVLIVLFQDL